MIEKKAIVPCHDFRYALIKSDNTIVYSLILGIKIFFTLNIFIKVSFDEIELIKVLLNDDNYITVLGILEYVNY